MIDIDSIIIKFIRTNIVTISIIVAILKVIAIETSWAIDDKIITIFTNFLKRKEFNNKEEK